DRLYSKIEAGTSLAQQEVVDVMQKLPNNLAEKYLMFTLTNIDYEKTHELVITRPASEVDEHDDRIECNDLIIDGAEVTYQGVPVHMQLRQRQALRLLMKNHGRLT